MIIAKLKTYGLAIAGFFLTVGFLLLRIKGLKNTALKAKVARQDEVLALNSKSTETAMKNRRKAEQELKDYEKSIDSGIDHDL